MTKKIFVEYTGVITSYSGNKQEWVEIEDDATIESLLMQLGYRKDFHKFITIRINGNEAQLDTPLTDQVAVTLFLPAGGG